MDTIVKALSTYSPLVYLLLAIIAIISGRQLMLAIRGEREAVFGLEHELAQRRINRSLSALIIIVLSAIAELTLSSFLVPILPGISFLATDTLDPLTMVTGTLPHEIEVSLGLITPEPSASMEPNGCIPGNIMLTFPKAGDSVKGIVTLRGIIVVANFGFYKYEYSPQNNLNWLTVQAGIATSTPVSGERNEEDGVLGIWNTSLLTPGGYLLRLVVVDNQGQEFPPCVIPVWVNAP